MDINCFDQYDPVRLCMELISINSENPGCYEKEVANFIQQLLKEHNIPHQVIFSAEKRANIIVRVNGKGSGIILFNGHLDTKPAGIGWDTNPFEPCIINNRLYGLGAADMKSGVACILHSLLFLNIKAIVPNSNLEIQLVADEEMNSTYGTQYLISEKLLTNNADLAIIAEPSEGLIVDRTLGNAWYQLRIQGMKSHAGYYWEGRNATQGFCLMNSMIREELRKYKYIDDPGFSHFPNFNVGSILASGHPGTVTDACTCTFEFRFRSEPERELFDRLLKDILNSITKEHGFTFDLEKFGGGGIPPMNNDHFLMNGGRQQKNLELQDIYCRITNQKYNPRSWVGGCDGGYINTLLDTPSFILGPGSLLQAHQPNEWVSIDEINNVATIFREIMTHL